MEKKRKVDNWDVNHSKKVKINLKARTSRIQMHLLCTLITQQQEEGREVIKNAKGDAFEQKKKNGSGSFLRFLESSMQSSGDCRRVDSVSDPTHNCNQADCCRKGNQKLR